MVTTIDGKLRLEWVAPGELNRRNRNPRRHSSSQISKIARSMRAFGNNVPILIDGKNLVISGDARLQAAQRLGLETVPVIRLEHLTPEQVEAFGIADNRLAELASWDDGILGEIFQELAAVDLDFDLEVTGFSTTEIDLRIEGFSGGGAAAPDPADALPNIPDQTAVTQPGDIWLLGRHRLLCGNALEEPAYAALMQGVLARAVFTDPPYNVRIDGHATGNGTTHHREFAMASGEMSPQEFTGFLSAALSQLTRHSTDGSLHYICMDWRHQTELLAAGQEVYRELKNLCVWVKDTPGMGSFYRSQHELVFVFKHGTAPHRNNVQLGLFGRNRSNVWTYPSVGGFGRQGEEGRLLSLHPTVKPVALVADAILDCTARGDVVLDSFLGSGTTLMAAERVGRVCYGTEIDPLYADTTIRRWQRFTGGQAMHARTGVSFEQVAAEREAENV